MTTTNIQPILDALTSTGTAPDWTATLNQILQAFDCTTGTIHRLDPETGLLTLVAYAGMPEFLLPKISQIPIGKGMAGIAAERREAVQLCNLQTDESGVARPAARDTKVEGSIALPLLLDGTLYGTLGIAKPVPYDFPAEEIAALEQIGDAMSRALA
ncbi:putative GAF sensor protein [Fibrella aestuarina BUZ 2]|uniref:Putative GAF sensor protein n=1 Tax=Fibrella aestuarina BUZ 2 TaxID=1166018 RepID=I0K7U1_9BACT|nr:GAF domain-containing protein [Fibrella aestuarina]CCH00194.1 putative GAF sensor protein [Fibrella aestuarina BUZ 2]